MELAGGRLTVASAPAVLVRVLLREGRRTTVSSLRRSSVRGSGCMGRVEARREASENGSAGVIIR